VAADYTLSAAKTLAIATGTTTVTGTVTITANDNDFPGHGVMDQFAVTVNSHHRA